MRLITCLASIAVGLSAVSASQAADVSAPAGIAIHDEGSSSGRFYVRGDVGIGRKSIGGLSQKDLADNGGTFVSNSIADSPLVGVGFGWQLSQRFRLDLTGEYHATAAIKAMDNLTATLTGPDGVLQANTLYQGNISSYVGLLNGYYDLFRWCGFTPYVGAGIGLAHHKTSGFTTASAATFTDAATGAQIVQSNSGTSREHSQTHLAWALMAGTSYDLSENAKLDLGWRYISLGSGDAAATSLLECSCGSIGAPLKMSDLEGHEFRIGIRWMLGQTVPSAYQAAK